MPSTRDVSQTSVCGAVVSTAIDKYVYVTVNKKSYLKLSGSSMATAVTTGVVAAALEARNWATSYYTVNPGRLTASEMKAMLQYTALPIHRADGTTPDTLTEGTGEVNAEGAVRLARLVRLRL